MELAGWPWIRGASRHLVHVGATCAIYRDPDCAFFATAGLCTHEEVHLADGLAIDGEIECPKHYGRFNCRMGRALRAPVCVNIRTFRVRVSNGTVEPGLSGGS